MDRFCEELRRERESRGVSLEIMSQETKISQRHLLALEQGRYDSLPGGIFRRGILRSYVSTLGLEPSSWMLRFESCLAEMEGVGESSLKLAEFAENVRRSRGEKSRREPTRWPGVFAMVVLLLVFGWALWRFALRGHLVLSYAGQPAPRLQIRPAHPA